MMRDDHTSTVDGAAAAERFYGGHRTISSECLVVIPDDVVERASWGLDGFSSRFDNPRNAARRVLVASGYPAEVERLRKDNARLLVTLRARA